MALAAIGLVVAIFNRLGRYKLLRLNFLVNISCILRIH